MLTDFLPIPHGEQLVDAGTALISPALQSIHSVAPSWVAYFPGTQDAQIVAADRLLYLPASQSRHAAPCALAASRIALPILPGGHWPQPSVTLIAPLFKPKVPFGQNDGHANVIRFAPTMSPYLPLWHCSHSTCPSTGLNIPAAQFLQATRGSVCPSRLLNLPCGHRLHRRCPCRGVYFPTLHNAHDICPFKSVYLPAVQFWHDACPVKLLYFPTMHNWQLF